jgi:hypothetical protein
MTVVTLGLSAAAAAIFLAPPIVEIEEDVYTYVAPDNGSGPLWCRGSTCIVRAGDRVFVSGTETVEDMPPLNNVRWTLWTRDDDGWRLVHRDTAELTREPSPLVNLGDGSTLLSANPTLNPPGTEGGGPAEPRVLRFDASDPGAQPEVLLPEWPGDPAFTEHSYRTFAADAQSHQALLMQNLGYTHAAWTRLDSQGEWSAQGELWWPVAGEPGAEYPLRLCYPVVQMVDDAMHFLGISDIIEPNPEWREYKRELTGREWDYDFRRLFYTSCPDLNTGDFSEWLEVASREETCGWITPCDIWVDPAGRAHLLWQERAIDERLRERFFPQAKQRHSLEYAIIESGAVTLRRTLLEGGEGLGGLVPGLARFQVKPKGDLAVFYHVGGSDDEGQPLDENRVLILGEGGRTLGMWTLDLEHPFTNFFVASPRTGSPPSNTLDILGTCSGVPATIRYARVALPD